MIERGLAKPGKTKGGLAAAMGVRPGAVSEILADIRQPPGGHRCLSQPGVGPTPPLPRDR